MIEDTATCRQDRCHRTGVCHVDAGCKFHPVCEGREQPDEPMFTPNFVVFAGVLLVVACILLGLFLGGMFVAYYDGHLTRTALATWRFLSTVGWGAATRLS